MARHELDQLIKEAEARIRPFIRETYLEASPHFSRLIEGRVLLKLENLQHTGSFKARGAVNKILSLDQDSLARGVIAASTGNHGAAVGYALAQVGGRGIVYVPEDSSPAKLANITRWGVEVRTYGRDSVEAERFARRQALEEGRVFISPYNDPQIIAGQGTIGRELLRQCAPPAAVFIALGGGGLISGVAAAVKDTWPESRIIACSPENSAVMYHSLQAGRILEFDSKPTLSDGTAGGVEVGSITFDLCRELIDDFVNVSEEEIAAALRAAIAHEHKLIEGAAAAALAGMLKYQRENRLKNRSAVVILCGANIDLPRLIPVLK